MPDFFQKLSIELGTFQLFKAVSLTVSSNRFLKRKSQVAVSFDGIFRFLKFQLVNYLNFINGVNGKFSTTVNGTVITELTASKHVNFLFFLV